MFALRNKKKLLKGNRYIEKGCTYQSILFDQNWTNNKKVIWGLKISLGNAVLNIL